MQFPSDQGEFMNTLINTFCNSSLSNLKFSCGCKIVAYKSTYNLVDFLSVRSFLRKTHEVINNISPCAIDVRS